MPEQIETAIPIGRRIGEIMEEKGDAFSYRAFGDRIGISKDILSRCINGERYIKPSELEKICRGLNISESRLKQEDVRDKRNELIRLLDSKNNPKRALHLAIELIELAIGMTEKSQVYNFLGRAYFELRQFNEAHQAWMEAYDHARRVNERFGEKETLGHIVKNLMLSFTARKEYIRMSEIIEEAQKNLVGMPEHLGAIWYSRAKLAEQLGDLEEAKRGMYQSYEQFLITGKAREIGVAKINIAHFEYKTKFYSKAKHCLEDAIGLLDTDQTVKWIALKEYAKVLIKMGDKSEAIKIIHQTLQDRNLRNSPNLYAKFYLLLALAEQNVAYAKDILEMENVTEIIRYSACVVLMNHYKQLGDSVSLMRYYEIAERSTIYVTDILEMEGF